MAKRKAKVNCSCGWTGKRTKVGFGQSVKPCPTCGRSHTVRAVSSRLRSRGMLR